MKDFSNQYLKLLLEDYKTINLTRISDSNEFYHKQILDSVYPLEKSSIFKNSIEKYGVVIDIGFGGGFPILPLAQACPAVKFYGMEARAKKARVVSEIANHLNLKNVKLMHQRYEEVLFDLDVVVTFKAVGKIADLLAGFSSNKKMTVFFYKGPNYKELEDLTSLENNWKLIEECTFDVEGTEGRTIIGFENKNVLRGTNEENKIKFSSLL